MREDRGMRILSAVVAFVMVSAISARAWAGEEESSRRSEGVATGLAIGGAVAGPALLFLANRIAEKADDDGPANAIGVFGGALVIVGPSFGHWYAGKLLTVGMALRAGGLAAGGLGLMANYTCIPEDTSCGHKPLPMVLMAAGGAALLGGTAWDLVTAHTQARRWNARHEVTLTPVPLGARGAGLVLGGRF
jgi:hypothetical protein